MLRPAVALTFLTLAACGPADIELDYASADAARAAAPEVEAFVRGAGEIADDRVGPDVSARGETVRVTLDREPAPELAALLRAVFEGAAALGDADAPTAAFTVTETDSSVLSLAELETGERVELQLAPQPAQLGVYYTEAFGGIQWTCGLRASLAEPPPTLRYSQTLEIDEASPLAQSEGLAALRDMMEATPATVAHRLVLGPDTALSARARVQPDDLGTDALFVQLGSAIESTPTVASTMVGPTDPGFASECAEALAAAPRGAAALLLPASRGTLQAVRFASDA